MWTSCYHHSNSPRPASLARYSPVNPDTGLHPRPGSPSHLAPLFPPRTIDTTYSSTVFPSRRGESLRGLQDRADLFVEAWTGRTEATGVRCVVVFAHAASVIAIGRAVRPLCPPVSRTPDIKDGAAQLTGDKSLNVAAGCASCSLYRRKGVPAPSEDTGLTASRSTSSLNAASSLLDLASSGDKDKSCGVGEWTAVWLGRADYLTNGLERDWSFRDVELHDGEVINVCPALVL